MQRGRIGRRSARGTAAAPGVALAAGWSTQLGAAGILVQAGLLLGGRQWALQRLMRRSSGACILTSIAAFA